MFNTDPKILARLAEGLDRVVVFDPQPYAAKMAGEVLRNMGARHITCSTETTRGLELIAHLEPQLICTERAGPDFDGVALITALRRSTLPSRQVPVIAISAEATVESIKSVRDSGAHEFLRKPFAAKDLFRRVENVILNPRPWIEAKMYVGPDRRRFNSGEFRGASKRRADGAPAETYMDIAS